MKIGRVSSEPNEMDVGPFRIDLLIAIWPRFARALDALCEIGAASVRSADVRAVLDAMLAAGRELVDDAIITAVLRLLALQDSMHANDWLRVRAAEAMTPRRKPPASTDLQMRLRGVQCRYLGARLVYGDGETPGGDRYRVTIENMRGDVASCEHVMFPSALEGALRMSGARRDEQTEEAT